MKYSERVLKVLTSYHTLKWLLLSQFILMILVYFNTNSFENISESSSNFLAINRLESGENVSVFQGGYRLSLAYIGYYIKDLFGSLSYFFIFQAILGVFASYITSLLVYEISKSRLSQNLTVLFFSVTTEFVLLPSIFYNQIFDIFFAAVVIYSYLEFITIKYYDHQILGYGFLVLVMSYLSLFFRGTLAYFWAIPLILAIIDLSMKNRPGFTKNIILAFSLIVTLQVVSPSKFFRENKIVPNDFVFFGHTAYGGGGGEGSFIYKENEERYNERIHTYQMEHNLDSLTQKDINEFQRSEIKYFIINEPTHWIYIQFRKFIYTFGAIAQRDGIVMLKNGEIKFPWYLAALMLQVPFIIIILSLIFFSDLNWLYTNIKKPEIYLIILWGIYLIGGTVFYGHYQERYRPIVLTLFFIPLIAININTKKFHFKFPDIKKMFPKIAISLIIVMIWLIQLYIALFIESERYLKFM